MKTLYGWLLRLFPAPFYRRFAHDMVADFNDGYSAACHGDWWTRFGFLARSYSDVIASAQPEWSTTEIFIVWRTAVLAALSIWGHRVRRCGTRMAGGSSDTLVRHATLRRHGGLRGDHNRHGAPAHAAALANPVTDSHNS